MFELPIEGAAGYAAIDTNCYPSFIAAQNNAVPSARLAQSTAFVILAEQGDFWQVRIVAQGDRAPQAKIVAQGEICVVRHADCFLNLPDVLPSAIYQNTNAKACVMHSVGRKIPGVTGKKLYESYRYNPRLGKKEYTMPVLYRTAQKIAAAHKAAFAQGDAIVVYELFRPQSTQMQVVEGLTALASQDAEVLAAITAPPWEMDWFIATGVSTHQRGMAMDVGLAKVQKVAQTTLPCATNTWDALLQGTQSGKCQTTAQTEHQGASQGCCYQSIVAYELYQMPTPIHELSRASASMAYPVTSRNDTAWRTTPNAPAMTQGACRLKQYCTDAGLTPLASEWWHFNDLEAIKQEGSEHFSLAQGLSK